MKVRLLSIDVGIHNMAFYMEEIDEKELNELCKGCRLNKGEKRFNENGEAIGKYQELVQRISVHGECLFVQKLNLSEKKGNQFDLQIFVNLSKFLNDNKLLMDTVNKVIIEQQLKTNPMAQRIEQHCISWFTFHYSVSKEIIVFPSRNKYIFIGMPKKMINKKTQTLKKITKTQRKKWACDVTLELLKQKEIQSVEKSKDGNIVTASQLLHYIFKENAAKKDDISDTICQLNAYKIKTYYGEP